MSTALSSIFGNEISVSPAPRTGQWQFAGFPGAHGVTAMNLGSRGNSFTVTGRIRATGASYALARANLLTALLTIEAWQWPAAEETFTFGSESYANCVMVRFQLVPGPDGKVIHWSATGAVFCDFVAYFVGLI